MYRYLVLIWNTADAVSAENARGFGARLTSVESGWKQVFAAGGVAAFHAGAEQGASGTLLLDEHAGVVFGRLFNRFTEDAGGACDVSLAGGESALIVRSGGRRLIERFWGRYVALVHDARTGECCVLRDPSGGMPCQMTRHRGVHLVFSDLEDCLELGAAPFTVNWNFIRRFVAYSNLQARETGLNEVAEIQFGERVRFAGESVQRSLEWDPIGLALTGPILDATSAATGLRRMTRSCVHAWAKCYSSVVHNLSGGLDSSIVLSCLRSAPSRPSILCVNYFGTGPDEDERRYARAMAAVAEVELIERPLDAREVRLEGILRLRRSARPWFYLYELEHGAFENQLAADSGADVVFSGSGGDGVFFQANAELAVSDYLFDHGMGAGLLNAAVDAARISRRSVWPMLVAALRSRVLPPRWHPLRLAPEASRTLIHPQVLAAARDDQTLVHPWLAGRCLRAVPPGTLWHILAVAAAPAFYSSFQTGWYPERTLPLMSQPLVEFCLRTPTYVLIRNGIDRATARRAFAADLPPEIIKRRRKGRIDQHMRAILDNNRGFVRELLLDGWLVRQGLLNRENLERQLTRGQLPADTQFADILHEHLCTEAWLRTWLG